MPYTFLDFAEEVLKDTPKPATYREIWATGEAKGLTARLPQRRTTPRTPWQTLASKLFVDVRDNPQSRFVKVGRNPARFFLASRKDQITSEDLNEPVSAQVPSSRLDNRFQFHERKLHPLLAYYAFTNLAFTRGRQIYSKTIFHEKSRRSALNEWVHPDMVGFYSPIDDWNDKLLEFNKATDKTAIRLYSFEIKKQINRGNYREYFFQAVSNSSWANEGYLVTCEVQQEDDLLAELERLSASLGIGIIVLDLDDIDSSTVLFPARQKDYLDWETMNKLCEQNKDFETFIDDVQRDYACGKIHPSEYDSIKDDPDAYAKEIQSEQTQTITERMLVDTRVDPS